MTQCREKPAEIFTGKTLSTDRLREHQRIIDQVRDEAAKMDREQISHGNRVLWITHEQATKLVYELADIEPMTESGQAKARFMRSVAGEGHADGLVDGAVLYLVRLKVSRIVLNLEA